MSNLKSGRAAVMLIRDVEQRGGRHARRAELDDVGTKTSLQIGQDGLQAQSGIGRRGQRRLVDRVTRAGDREMQRSWLAAPCA
jgi:hypothetical protein